MDASIEVIALSKVYQDGEFEIRAVDDVSFSVPAGQFLCIRGPSGSGKSTLLHLLGALLQPTSGSVRVAGTDITSLSESQAAVFRRRHVGMVFQFFNLIPHLTVEENVALPQLLDGMKLRHVRPRIKELLGELGLEQRLKQRTGQLSGGQLQRVALARALVAEPDLILADEPTGNLDRAAGERVYGDLRDLAHRHRVTTIMVTHDPDATGYADRVIEIVDGRIRSDSAAPDAPAAPTSEQDPAWLSGSP